MWFIGNKIFLGWRNFLGFWNYIFGNVFYCYVNNFVCVGNMWCRIFLDFGRGKSVVYGEKWFLIIIKGGKYEILV